MCSQVKTRIIAATAMIKGKEVDLLKVGAIKNPPE